MKIKKLHELIYKIDHLLSDSMLMQIHDEFHPLYNNWAWKQESNLLENPKSYPMRLGLAKKSGDTLGWSLPIIDLSVTLKIIAERLLERKLNLYRINTNIQLFGQESCFHRDGHEECWTFLVFANRYWDENWGGDFKIKLPTGDCLGLTPEHNCGILFNASLDHKGDAPNRLCTISRHSIACSFEEVHHVL